MLTMDVWNADPFTAVSTTAAIDKLGYIPTWLGDLGIFTPEPVTTDRVLIEERGTDAALIQTTARGAPPRQTGTERREVFSFETVRLADASRITASQLQGIRAFGSYTELTSLQIEVARRQFRIKNNFALTMENLRLSTVCGGITKDADGAVLVNWGTKLNNPMPAPVAISFAGDGTEGLIRNQFAQVGRSVKRSLRAGNTSDITSLVCVCGDNFFDRVVSNKETRASYLSWSAAADLRGKQDFETFPFANILFANYRGTDDQPVDGDGKSTGKSSVGVDADVGFMFPQSRAGSSIFKMALAPAERFEFVNTMGQDIYSFVVVDPLRNSWADIEVYKYPLPVCTLPSALRQLTIDG